MTTRVFFYWKGNHKPFALRFDYASGFNLFHVVCKSTLETKCLIFDNTLLVTLLLRFKMSLHSKHIINISSVFLALLNVSDPSFLTLHETFIGCIMLIILQDIGYASEDGIELKTRQAKVKKGEFARSYILKRTVYFKTFSHWDSIKIILKLA